MKIIYSWHRCSDYIWLVSRTHVSLTLKISGCSAQIQVKSDFKKWCQGVKKVRTNECIPALFEDVLWTLACASIENNRIINNKDKHIWIKVRADPRKRPFCVLTDKNWNKDENMSRSQRSVHETKTYSPHLKNERLWHWCNQNTLYTYFTRIKHCIKFNTHAR